MPTFDLVIRGGEILTSSGITEADIGISDGKIAAINKSDHIFASRSFSADGKLILPGLLDSHVHFRDPGLTHKEDFETGTKGAAAGGVTAIFDMPTTLPVVTTEKLFLEKIEAVKGKAFVDYGLFGAAAMNNLGDISKLADAGAIAFKTYTVSPPRGREKEYEGSFVTNSGQLLQVMREVKKTRLVHCIHAEEDSTVSCLTDEMIQEGRKDPMAHFDSRPNFTEAEAVCDAVAISKAIDCRVHIVHASTEEATDIIRNAKRHSVKLTAETCPHYLYFSKEILEQKGPYAKYNPPARSAEDKKSLLEGIGDGTIDMVATDHAPHTKDEKEKGHEDIFKAPPGTPGVETRLPLLFTLASKGLLSLMRIPELASTAVARSFGLYPAKGMIAVGSDADLVIVDHKREWTIKAADLQTKAWETVIYDGMAVKGKAECTIVRGQVAFEEGTGFRKPGTGKLIRGNPV